LRKSKLPTVESLIGSIDAALQSFQAAHVGLTLREKVLLLGEILTETKALGVAVARADGCDAGAARERLRLYLTQNVGVPLEAIELEVVAGISEYGRRVRELRVQDGYKIITGASNDPDADLKLSPKQYLLLEAEPDKEAARRWHIANRIRKDKTIGGQTRILHYLLESVGQVVTSEELYYVSGDAKEFGRRTRELRTQQGYAVATHFTGRPDLKQGEYVLETAERLAPEHDRHIPVEVQREVYGRDSNTCRVCGWNRELWTRADPRFLELHHLKPHVEKGENIAENLIVVCSRCHDDIHAKRIEAPTP
jgi:hypothetical protein